MGSAVRWSVTRRPAVGEQLGINHDTLRGWVARAEIDAGQRPGSTSADAAGIADLERLGRGRLVRRDRRWRGLRLWVRRHARESIRGDRSVCPRSVVAWLKYENLMLEAVMSVQNLGHQPGHGALTCGFTSGAVIQTPCTTSAPAT